MDKPALTAALRARVARPGRATTPDRPALGGGVTRDAGGVPLFPALDAALPGGAGLPRAALHEVVSPGGGGGGPGAAAGFCALLLARAAAQGGAVFWISDGGGRGGGEPRPPGLARFGLAPHRLVLVAAGSRADALWAAEEALRCPAVRGALLDTDAPADPNAARRLQLAAETGGGIGLVLREEGEGEGAAGGVSAATTRWRVSGRAGIGPSRQDLGDPRWTLDLLRCRGGRPSTWGVTWRAADEALVPEDGEAAADDGTVARRIAAAGGGGDAASPRASRVAPLRR